MLLNKKLILSLVFFLIFINAIFLVDADSEEDVKEVLSQELYKYIVESEEPTLSLVETQDLVNFFLTSNESGTDLDSIGLNSGTTIENIVSKALSSSQSIDNPGTLEQLWNGEAEFGEYEYVQFSGHPTEGHGIGYMQGGVSYVSNGEDEIYAYFRQNPSREALEEDPNLPNFAIFMATSKDGGKTFQAVEKAPIGYSDVKSLNWNSALDPDVIKRDDGYYMVFETGGGGDSGCGSSAAIAYSKNGFDWDVKNIIACVPLEYYVPDIGYVDMGSASVPNIFEDPSGQLYLQWSSLIHSEMIATKHQIKFDMDNLFKRLTNNTNIGQLTQPSAGSWNDKRFDTGDVIREGDYYYMFYLGGNHPSGKNIGIGLARTKNIEDINSWEHWSGNPFLEGYRIDEEYVDYHHYPEIIKIDGSYYIYFNYFCDNARRASGDCQLGDYSAKVFRKKILVSNGQETVCSDSTAYGECSIDKPKYCNNGNLENNCQACGCPSGQECQSDGSCEITEMKCSDGTSYNSCSANKPKYCDNGNLVNKCGTCGCPAGQSCKSDGSCSSTPGILKDNGDGTITDTSTGLVWLKNTDCFGSVTWTNANSQVSSLSSGSCGLSDGSSAGDWRLPSIREIMTLSDTGNFNPALPDNHPFTNVQSKDKDSNYWSATPYQGLSGNVWVFNIRQGGSGWYGKGQSDYVLPVRSSGSVQGPVLSDNGDGTITDTSTGLVWLKNADCFGSVTWTNANSQVSSLSSGSCGLSDGSSAGDWRLPTIDELGDIADYSRYNPSLPLGHPFSKVHSENGDSNYWSGSEYLGLGGNVWVFNIRQGVSGWYGKGKSDYALAVREAKEMECSDGTAYNSCVIDNSPKYCNNNGVIINNCQTCECPSGQECQSDGSCEITETPKCTPPANIQPESNTTIIAQNGKINISWDAVPDVIYYNVRMADGTSDRYDDPRFDTCGSSSHYYCENKITVTQITNIPVKEGRKYTLWIDPVYSPTRNYCNGGSVFDISYKEGNYKVEVRMKSSDGVLSNFGMNAINITSSDSSKQNILKSLSKAIDSETYDWYTLGTIDYNTDTKIRLSDWSSSGLVIDKLRLVEVNNSNVVLDVEAEHIGNINDIIIDNKASGRKAVKRSGVGIYIWWVLPDYKKNITTISGHVFDDSGEGVEGVKIDLCYREAVTDENGYWIKTTTIGQPFCARIYNPNQSTPIVTAINNRKCHPSSQTYEWQIAGQNHFENCNSDSPTKTWDLENDNKYDFVLSSLSINKSCGSCGEGLFNLCDEDECSNLGNCNYYQNYLLGGVCAIDCGLQYGDDYYCGNEADAKGNNAIELEDDVCDEKGNDFCIQSKECSDGTRYGQCKTGNPPLYCDNGNLVSKCSTCKCPTTTSCRTDETCGTPVDDTIYCGYAMTANEGVGNGNYINEVGNFSNFITIKSANVEDDIEKIQESSTYGAKTALWIDHLFFNLEIDDQGGLVTITLYDDYMNRWNEYAKRIEPYIDNISMFYGLDEPYWNAYRCSDKVSANEMKNMLEIVSYTVKSTFPKAKMANVFAAVPTLNEDYQIDYVNERNEDFEFPAGYDYVGFDYYYASSLNYQSSVSEWKNQYNSYLDFFKSKMDSEHRLMLIPDSFHKTNVPVKEDTLIEVAEFYSEIMDSDSSVKVFAPFLYPSNPQLKGAKDLHLLNLKYQNILGKCASKFSTCSDGTDHGSCSGNKPKYCDNGNLVNKCGTCGCPSGQECQSDGSCEATISVKNFVLVNADTDLIIQPYNPLINNATIDFKNIGTKNINIIANTNPSNVGSVKMYIDGNLARVENGIPYTLAGDMQPDYLAIDPVLSKGIHTIKAVPYSGKSGTGIQGSPLEIKFSIR